MAYPYTQVNVNVIQNNQKSSQCCIKLKYTFMVQYPRPYRFTRFIRIVIRRPCTITSLTHPCFNPAHTSTPRAAFSPCYCKQRNRLLNHIAISSCQILSYGWVNQSPNDSIAVASNTRPSDYESHMLTTAPLKPHMWTDYKQYASI